jgi:kynurenine formamidase
MVMTSSFGNGEMPLSLTRRRLLEASIAGLLPAALLAGKAEAASGVQEISSDADMERALPSLTNWGRWGKQDQIGTLNFITPQTRLRAASLIKTGDAFPLAREISLVTTPNLRDVNYRMKYYFDAQPEESGSLDHVGMIWHGFGVTHMDALCHLFTPEGKDGMYNGYPVSAMTDQGAEMLGIEHVGAFGVAGRGVLLDIAALKGGPLQPGSAITRSDLEAAERAAGLTVGEGDILFVCNGAGPKNTYQLGSGLHADCMPWLQEKRVAVLSGDSDSDVHPPVEGFARWTEPVHMVGIPYMGLTLVDQVDLDALARHCKILKRWEFFVTIAPWRIKGTTGSPVNPIAIF